MALRTPPRWLQAGVHTAEDDRLWLTSLMGIQGVVNVPGYLPQTAAPYTGDLAVNAVATPSMNVVISAGAAYIKGSIGSSTTQGIYHVYNDAPITASVATAPTSNSRIDLVVLQITDASYGSTTSTVVYNVISGTASASPVAPATPASSIALAQILVGTNVTSITGSNITDLRTRTGPDDLFVQSAAVGDDALTIQALAGQTGNLLSVRNASGTVVGGFTASGSPIGGGGYSDIFLLMGA